MGHIRFWEYNQFSASEEFPHILWNPNVHCHIRRFPSPVPIVCQLEPVQTPTPNILSILSPEKYWVSNTDH